MRRLAAACALLLAAAAACSSGDEGDTVTAEAIVSVGRIERVTVRAGESTTLDVPLVVADGYKVQANPAAADFLVPLELTLEPVDGLEFGDPEYPPSHRHRLQGAEDDLLTYKGRLVIRVPVTASPGASGAVAVNGSLRYQGCDARRCFFPTSVPVVLEVVVAPNR